MIRRLTLISLPPLLSVISCRRLFRGSRLSAVLCAVIYQTFCLFADSLLKGTLCTAHRLLFFYNKNLPQMAEIHSRSNITGFGKIVGVH